MTAIGVLTGHSEVSGYHWRAWVQVAHWRTSVRLQLAVLRQAIQSIRRTTAPCSNSHWREAIRVFRLRATI